MSNSVVGNVYDRIIKEVVDTSRLDFEESGIDDSVLEELRSVSHSFRWSSSGVHSHRIEFLSGGSFPCRRQSHRLERESRSTIEPITLWGVVAAGRCDATRGLAGVGRE